MSDQPRSTAQRRADTEARLRDDIDAWIATADPATGVPHLIPLSFLHHQGALYFSTAVDSRTVRNLQASPAARVGLGPTRDVVLIEGTVTILTADEIEPSIADAFAAKVGFEPRRMADRYRYLRFDPTTLHAWREENELAARTLMRDGVWR